VNLPARTRDRIAALFFVFLVIVTSVSVIWTMRHGWAVYQLRRGVGDTWFYSADGKPWFRMDEHRRDVTLDQISPDLQHAVVAVEDHRFYRHFGIDPLGTSRAIYRDVRGGAMEG
jgi:penicillin-binding protein 1A